MKRYAHKIRDSSKNPRQAGGGFFMPWLILAGALLVYAASSAARLPGSVATDHRKNTDRRKGPFPARWRVLPPARYNYIPGPEKRAYRAVSGRFRMTAGHIARNAASRARTTGNAAKRLHAIKSHTIFPVFCAFPASRPGAGSATRGPP